MQGLSLIIGVFLALDTLFLGLKALTYNGFRFFQETLIHIVMSHRFPKTPLPQCPFLTLQARGRYSDSTKLTLINNKVSKLESIKLPKSKKFIM